MTRAWLLVLLTVPALARAQAASGTVAFDNGHPRNLNYINAAECAGSGSIELTWTVRLLGGATAAPADALFKVYASNVAHQTDLCWTDGDTNANPPRFAGQIGVDIDTTALSDTVDFDPSLFVSAAGEDCAGSDEQIFVCVQGTSPGGNWGIATGTLNLSVTQPGAPTITGVAAGDKALEVSWDAPDATSAPRADWYELVASTATGSRTVSDIVATSHRLTGLVNDVPYTLQVFAFSVAGNKGPGSSTAIGTPKEVDDFWDEYKDLGGREMGGCAGGPAGLASLAAAVSLLAVLRRRK